MNKLIDDEKILYWATSNYTPRAIAEIFRICERYGLEPPIAD